jgi:hypothetical protein
MYIAANFRKRRIPQTTRQQVVARYGTTTTESLLSLHVSLTQLGADWRMLAPSILFEATTTPIQWGAF